MDGISSVSAPGASQVQTQTQTQAQTGISAEESALINQAAGQTAASFLMHMHNEQKKMLQETSNEIAG